MPSLNLDSNESIIFNLYSVVHSTLDQLQSIGAWSTIERAREWESTRR